MLDKCDMIVTFLFFAGLAICVALSLHGCAPAPLARASAMPGTPSAAEYNAADAAFAGGTIADSWTAERCQIIMDRRDALTWVAAFSGGLSGAGGLSTAFPDDERRDLRLGLGVSSIVLASLATSAALIAKMKTSEFEMYCGVIAP